MQSYKTSGFEFLLPQNLKNQESTFKIIHK